MGCDWIDGDCSVVGYVLRFQFVFNGTDFGNVDTIHDDDTTDELILNDIYDEMKENGQDVEFDDIELPEQAPGAMTNPHKAIKGSWLSFISKHYPSLIGKDIFPYIGATSMPGAYEKQCYANSCSVVFGYKLAITEEAKEGDDEIRCVLPALTFPQKFPVIVQEFVEAFKTEYALKTTGTASKKARCTPDAPELKIVTFVC